MVAKDTARNREIRKRRRNSETLASIGKDYALTRGRIRQICIDIPKPPGKSRAVRGWHPLRPEGYTKKTRAIYGLYAEGEDMPRYIGKAQKLRSRLSGHNNAIRFTKAIYRIELPDLGLQIRVIEEVEEHNWKERERYWIDYFTERGVKLANADPEETRIKAVNASAARVDRNKAV